MGALFWGHPADVRGQGYDPSIAPQHLRAATGLRVSLFAHEPEVRQAIFVKCDDRGRLWTIQYLQYPNPAGLQRVKVDRWSRTIYDRIPEPPPHGPRGADRITILRDTDADGRADQYHDFLTGLNLVTGVEFGHGGVYVLNVPYLLFYPDENQDDQPDGDPRVLLTGFGMEDAQSFANHLTWGPDGWLYGVNGSTTTCRIRGIEFQQGVWRYHPLRDQFELFCEGGSNCFGVTFDELGNLFYSTNGGPFVAALQGAYYFKSFGKHGPLHNRFAYHFFPNLECDQIPGGPPTGGTIYQGSGLPGGQLQNYRGKFLAGNFLGHTVSWWHVDPWGATVRARWGGYVLETNDTWSGPTDLCVGPDGAIYVSDFFDQRTAHPDPDATWDLRNGRIYRIDEPGMGSSEIADMRNRPIADLVHLQSSPDGWMADRARVELARRRDTTVTAQFDQQVRQATEPQMALRALWGRYVSADLPDELACEWLGHRFPEVRRWIVRWIGDAKSASPAVAEQLQALARRETDVTVQAQLAASAKRLPGETGLKIVWGLCEHLSEPIDERVEWSLWWALEQHAMSQAAAIAQYHGSPDALRAPITQRLARLLTRRYAAEGTESSYQHCATLLAALLPLDQIAVLTAVRDGLAERNQGLPDIGQGGLFEDQAEITALPSAARQTRATHVSPPVGPPLAHLLRDPSVQQANEWLSLELLLLAGLPEGPAQLLERLQTWRLTDRQAGPADNRPATPTGSPEVISRLARLVAQFGTVDHARILLNAWQPDAAAEIPLAILDALAPHLDDSMTQQLLDHYPRTAPEVQAGVRDLLFQRTHSALRFVQWMDRQGLPPDHVPLSQVRRMALHASPPLDQAIREKWGNVGPGTAEEKLATMRRFNNDLRAGVGDAARGNEIFKRQCGKCHRLFGEGGMVGPDLTSTSRQDRAALLGSIVDPSAVVRRDYLNFVVHTTSGQVLTGLLAEQDGASITLLDAEGKRVRIARDEVDEMVESNLSLMPEKLLDALSPQELRDLFAYLQRE